MYIKIEKVAKNSYRIHVNGVVHNIPIIIDKKEIKKVKVVHTNFDIKNDICVASLYIGKKLIFTRVEEI